MTFSESWAFIWHPNVSRKKVFSGAIALEYRTFDLSQSPARRPISSHHEHRSFANKRQRDRTVWRSIRNLEHQRFSKLHRIALGRNVLCRSKTTVSFESWIFGAGFTWPLKSTDSHGVRRVWICLKTST